MSTFLIMSPVQIMSDIKVSPRERDIILKYDLDMEGCEDWDLNRWEEYEIDTWNLKQELMGRYYQIFPSYEEGETEEDKEEREKWEEEEEIAKQKYFRQLDEWKANNKGIEDKDVEAIYYSDEEEEEEEEVEKDDRGEEKEDPADTKSNGPFFTPIPQELTMQPDPGEPKSVKSTQELDENEASGEKRTKEGKLTCQTRQMMTWKTAQVTRNPTWGSLSLKLHQRRQKRRELLLIMLKVIRMKPRNPILRK